MLEFVVGKDSVRTKAQQSTASGVDFFDIGDILLSVPEHYILGDMVRKKPSQLHLPNYLTLFLSIEK